jgi:hypothetical protein
MPNPSGVSNSNSPTRRTIAINGSAGAYVLISASIFAGYAEIQEVPPGSEAAGGAYTGGVFTGQGVNIQRADENYVNTYGMAPGAIWQIGDAIRKNHCEGVPAMTMADGSARPATPWIKVKSATVTATQVECREWRQQ